MSGAEFKWIWLGAVLPDIPFVIKRTITFTQLNIDILDVRLLSVVQASLLFSLILAFACSRFSKRPGKVFLILGLGVSLHLLMDACQIKWGNGPRLLVPFDWSITNFNLFWPEQMPSHVLTGIGIATIFYVLRLPSKSQVGDLRLPGRAGWVFVVFSLVIYLAVPFALFKVAEQSGAGSVQLIRQADRTGRDIELDRARFRTAESGDTVELFAGHFIGIEGLDYEGPANGKVSVRGTFVAHDRIRVNEYHMNYGRFRELASLIGLGVIFVYWLIILAEWIRLRQRH